MEDLYLKYTEPDTFRHVVNKINNSKAARDKLISNFIRPIKDSLKSHNLEVEIKGRPKSVFSIWNKMKKQDIPFEEVYDLFAVRIIIDTSIEKEKAVCWQIYSIVTDFYHPSPDRLRDWVSTPKANGYESLHTTVMSPQGQWVEVQIRTKRMDDIAEKGYAAHWKYKESKSQESGLEQWIKRVRDTLDQNDTSALEFVDDFRGNLFNDEVFVFTPKGDLKTLPNGATALDFAFDIHTQVGAKCLGAKVNQKLVPLNHVLKNGDQVEILTSKKQKPGEDWLKFVITSRAKSKIKDLLKEEKKDAAQDGKEIVLRKLKQLKLSLNQDTIEQLLGFFNVKTPLEFFFRVGTGAIPAIDIKKFQDYNDDTEVRQKSKHTIDAKSIEHTLRSSKGRDNDTILIGEDMDVFDYKLSKCCNPIAGDSVFGFVTVNEGIKIHRTTCPNAAELMSNHGYRIVKAKWTSQKEIAFLVTLNIVGTDRIGLINDVTRIISNELIVNMRSITVKTDIGIFDGNIELYVNDTRHLDILIEKLEKVDGIVNVSRLS
jgi:GTP pyrophosphokinase